MAKFEGKCIFDATHVLGIVPKVVYNEKDNPKTVEVSIDFLKDILTMVEQLQTDTVFITVVSREFPLTLKVNEEDDMAFTITPRLS